MPADLQSPTAVRELFLAATSANHDARCREGSVDRISGPGTLIASGDLHDNPVHLAKLVEIANLDAESEPSEGSDSAAPCPSPTHLTLHEIIHSEKLINGVDLSYRAFARVAQLKCDHPERVHTLLANHELSQIAGAGIVKEGRNVVQSFNDGVEYVFGDEAGSVTEAINGFVRSMPLALICKDGTGRGVLCAHSLPSPNLMDRFDPGVLERELTEDDYVPRRGSAHIMVWGRNHTPEQLGSLGERWGISLFLLGHEKAEDGALLREPNAVILNSDHERGAYMPIDLSDPPDAPTALSCAVRLGG